MLSVMPQTTSAAKALRGSKRRRANNDRWRLKFRALERKFRRALAEGPSTRGEAADDAGTLYLQLQSTLDRMARRDILHRNTAARRKSRLVTLLQRNRPKIS